VTYYPAFLDLRGQRCVVVGDGLMAARKARDLLLAQATVVVYATMPCQELLETGATLVTRAYKRGDLAGARVAVDASGDPSIAAEMRAEADVEHVLLNVVDNAEQCDFIAPAIVRRGPLQLAISTSGESPFLAVALRKRLESELGQEWREFVRLVGEVRRDLRKRGLSIDEQTAIYQRLLESSVLDLLREGAVAAARREAERLVRQGAQVA
jgi:siroheme synthase-like protein